VYDARAVSDIPRSEDLPGLIDKGLAMVEDRLGPAGGWPIYQSIQAQLTYVKRTLESRQSPDPAMVDKLLLGVYAAREFETSDREFADVLFAVEYLFKRWDPT
jgi:hypothetical protein